jgi:hypothetical protein
MQKSYAPRILVELTVGATTYRFATEDLYDTDGNFYEGTLLNEPVLRESLLDRFWGTKESMTVQFRFGNRSGAWHSLVNSGELRGVVMTIKYYDPANLGDTELTTEYTEDDILLEDGDTILMESAMIEILARGKIQEYDVREEASITAELNSMDVLETILPKKAVNTTDWPKATDLGMAVNIIFGRSKNVPLRYFHYDFDIDEYDYLIGYGPIQAVDAVYRDGALVSASEYTVFDGTQESPYPGYAFIRFILEQKDFGGRLYTLTADIQGYPRNFAYVIEQILSDSTWGLGESVDENSFAGAKDDLNTIGSMYCDGAITGERRAKDVIDELLFLCRGYLTQNGLGEWQLFIDTYKTDVIASFGHSDGYYENILEIESRSALPATQAYKSVTLHYAKNDRKQKPYYENKRDVFSFGIDKSYETDFVQDHTTADKITCYLARLAQYADKKLGLMVGMDGRTLDAQKIVSVNIPDYSISGNYKIEEIEKHLEKFGLMLSEYSSDIYTYVAGDIPADELADEDQDYKNIHPSAPS